jgi:hypothetical protein
MIISYWDDHCSVAALSVFITMLPLDNLGGLILCICLSTANYSSYRVTSVQKIQTRNIMFTHLKTDLEYLYTCTYSIYIYMYIYHIHVCYVTVCPVVVL